MAELPGLVETAVILFSDRYDAGVRRGAFLFRDGRPVAFGRDDYIADERVGRCLGLLRERLAAAGYACGELEFGDGFWVMPLEDPSGVMEDDTRVVGAIVLECWRLAEVGK
jgi:hypothetical protein